MNPDQGAGLLHRLTSYGPGRDWDEPADDPRVRHDLIHDDLSTLPPQIKTYPDGLPVLALPRELPDPGIGAMAALAGPSPPARSLDAAQLGRVLFLGAGVVRTTDHPLRGQLLFRASGSAGGRFPLEVYVSAHGVAGVIDGIHWYDPLSHALRQVGPPAHDGVTTIVVAGVPWRTGWRYAERGWRHLYWDGGTLVSQLLVAARSAGLGPRLRTRFPDATVGRLVGADPVLEYPLALVSLGDGPPAIDPSGPARTGDLPAVELPLCTQAQRAGDRDEMGDPWPEGPVVSGVAASPSVDAVIGRRGSQRLMDRRAVLAREVVQAQMAAAMRGIEVPHWLVAHGVEGLEPGVYRWPDLDAPVRTGDLREELERIALGQTLAADAAYVVIGAIDPARLDDRTYREAQLAAGIVEGRLHLAAYALGATASGMTFLDTEVPGLVGEPDDLVTLLFTCVGVGEYRSRPGGGPGAPVPVRSIVPRFVEDG